MNSTRKTPSPLGGILLVIGNVIGAGILALPLATAQLGLPYAILTIFFFWLLMMLGAYYFLEANLALPQGSNLISMSRLALGKGGVLIAWVCNLLVMYSLISAYIAGGSDLISINFHYLGFTVPSWVSPLCFLFIFGFIVSRGMHITDHANRLLMTVKALVFLSILIGLSRYFHFDQIALSAESHLSASLLIIVLTSYGFAVLIPSLRTYYQSDVKVIKSIIFWGTLTPFICYLLWITLVFAVIPYEGSNGLHSLSQSAHPVSGLQSALSEALHSEWITQAANLFSAICIITSFLANSISLTDFIADGLNWRKSIWVYALAYLPALAAVIFYPKAFLMGLSIAGSLAVVQLLLLPGCIVWFLRYSKRSQPRPYTVFGGKPLLLFLLIIGVLLFVVSFLT